MILFRVCLWLGIAVCHVDAAFLERRLKVQTVKQHLNGAGTAPNSTVMLNKPPKHTNHDRVGGRATVALQPETSLQNNMTSLHADFVGNSSDMKWGAGVVHFLFLVTDNIPHSDIWRQFFGNAPQGSWRVFVHCKDIEGCQRNRVFTDNPGFMPVPTTPTWYCHDLVTAMASLLTGALQANAAMVGGREKFVFLSESTLPIKPFGEIHSSLLLDDNSDICLFPSNQWGSASIDGSFVKLLKHHQWVVLSRGHAELFVREWVPVNAQSHWQVWLKSGTWQGHDRHIAPQSFYYPASANTCTDEWAFMATIFGALEPMNGARYLPGFGGGHIDMNTHLTQGRCRTWTYWDNTWDPDATALGGSIANDFYGSRMSCYPKCHARPATLEKVSHSSLHALRKSPFLFARKFSSTIWMPHFYSIVLSP